MMDVKGQNLVMNWTNYRKTIAISCLVFVIFPLNYIENVAITVQYTIKYSVVSCRNDDFFCV